MSEPMLGLGAGVAWLGEMDVAAVATDLDGAICGWNRAVAELYGREARDMLGMSVQTVLLASADQAVAPSIIDVLLELGRWRGELAIQTASGLAIRLDVRARVVLDDGGQPAGFEAVLVDVSERVEVERRVGVLEARLRLAHRIAGLSSWEWDLREDRVVPSDSFSALLGLVPGTELTLADALAALPPRIGGA